MPINGCVFIIFITLLRLFCCNHTCYCVNMVSVTSASRYITSASIYHPHYQNRTSMYIRGLIPHYFAEFTGAVPIALGNSLALHYAYLLHCYALCVDPSFCHLNNSQSFCRVFQFRTIFTVQNINIMRWLLCLKNSEYDQENHNHKLQTNPCHLEEEPHNNHATPERQTK